MDTAVDIDEAFIATLDGGSAEPLRHPGEAAPCQPVLLVGPMSAFDEAGITQWLGEHSWPSAWAADVDRAKWLACIQRISLVAIAGDIASVRSLVQSIRPVIASPLVVLGNPPASVVVTLIADGVDAVIDPLGGPDEVFARVVALLRRLDDSWEPGVRYLVADELRVDLWSQQCESRGKVLRLSPTEYSLLTFLMTHPHRALASQTIVRKVWKWPPTDGRNTLRIFVNRLRRKLGDDSRRPRYIESVRGTGYRFLETVTEIGDSAKGATASPTVTPLLNSLESLATGLLCCDSVTAATDHLLTCVEATAYADALVLFRVNGGTMRLVGQRHMPEWWVDQVSAGVPLCYSFAGTQSVSTGGALAPGDVVVSRDDSASGAQQLLRGDYHASMYAPLLFEGGVWGHIGLIRRARQSFDFTCASFLRSAIATFTLALERLER